MLFNIAVLYLASWWSVEAIRFKLEPSRSPHMGKGDCITYRIKPNQLVTGKLYGTANENYVIGAHIYGRDGSQPISLKDLTGETPFSFLAGEKQNEYDVCFRATAKSRPPVPGQMPPPPPPNLQLPVGVVLSWVPDLFDEKLAAEAKLRPVEADFFASEERMRQVADELSSYLKNEERLRDVNESILERITWLSFLSIGALVALGIWQIMYLKKYFRTKKLI